MIYAQFYENKIDGTLGEALGDRAIYVLDGRNTKSTWHTDAKEHGRKYGYLAYSIHKGHLRDHKQTRDIHLID